MKWARGVGFAVSWGRVSDCCEAQLITFNIKGNQMRTCLKEAAQIILVSFNEPAQVFLSWLLQPQALIQEFVS